MTHVSIRPAWTIEHGDGVLPPRLIDLLVQVDTHGSLQTAARALGLSYRHAWDLVRQGEALFQRPVLLMARGRGSQLTELGARIVWADRRIVAKLGPLLESLASELAAELRQTLEDSPPRLRIWASHGFAIERLVQRLGSDGLPADITWSSSLAAAAALQEGDCDLAGFHIPLGSAQDALMTHYRPWLQDGSLCVIHIAIRRQGLMVAAGNPHGIYSLADLARPEVRFINRESGSGTRVLLEALLADQGIAPGRISGFERGEYTHAAIAAYVASGMADVGFGLEPPARHFHLDYVPIARERYFLLCHADKLQQPTIQQVVALLTSAAFQARLAELPGYDPHDAGRITRLNEGWKAAPQQQDGLGFEVFP